MATRAKAKHLADVDVVAGAAESIPLCADAVAALWMSQVVHHIEDLENAAFELNRVLRPGGRLRIRGAFGHNDETGSNGADFVLYR
jgi:ubiquinone/menaquinone biosynthesis C-methylase UbiE